MRDSESRFRSLIEGLVEIILVCDSHGVIQHINEVGAQRLEWTPQELMGKPLTTILMEGTGPAGPGADSCRQSVYCTRTGKRFEAEETLRTIVFDGRPAVMRVARDMTERKRAEEEKTSLEDQLRQAQKMEAIGTLAGGVAHDFNNLLTVILCHVHLMKMRTKPGEELYQDVATIETVVHRANSLTEQLLGFARRGKYQNTVVDVRSTIREVMGFLSRTLDKKIVLREECTTEEAVVLGDPGQLHQVILNLSVNARDAMPEGGALTFRTEVVEASDAIRKRVPGAVAERYVVVSVSDTGSGISEEVRGRIFEPFFTTKEPGKGTGMGLAMVYGIMQNHSGFVEVGTAVGQGTTFTLYLPQAKQAVLTQEPAREEAPVRGSGKVLLVDDEELVRNVAARLLKHLGYEVEMASDGQDAADYYREHWREITLVILDMIMPRMNGRECFHALQAINPEVKAILITGYDKNHGAQGILDEGVQGFVQKPFELNQFSKAIDQAIQAEPKPGLARST